MNVNIYYKCAMNWNIWTDIIILDIGYDLEMIWRTGEGGRGGGGREEDGGRKRYVDEAEMLLN